MSGLGKLRKELCKVQIWLGYPKLYHKFLTYQRPLIIWVKKIVPLLSCLSFFSWGLDSENTHVQTKLDNFGRFVSQIIQILFYGREFVLFRYIFQVHFHFQIHFYFYFWVHYFLAHFLLYSILFHYIAAYPSQFTSQIRHITLIGFSSFKNNLIHKIQRKQNVKTY